MPESRSEAVWKLDHEAEQLLKQFRWRLIWQRASFAFGLCLSVSLLFFVGALLLDRYLLLPVVARMALTLSTVAVFVVSLAFAVGFTLHRLRWRHVAQRLDELTPELTEAVRTTFGLGASSAEERQRYSSVLLSNLERFVVERVERLDPASRLPWKRSYRSVAVAAAVAVVVVAWAGLAPSTFGALAARFLQPTSDLPRPSSVHLVVFPGSRSFAIGSTPVIRAGLNRGRAQQALLTLRYGDRTEVAEMTADLVRADGGTWARWELPALSGDVHYRVRAGDFVSQWYTLAARPPPAPSQFRFIYQLPAYTGRAEPVVKESADGGLRALAATRVTLEVESDALLRVAVLRLHRAGDEADAAAATLSGRIHAGTVRFDAFTLDRDLDSYDLLLEGADGVTNSWGQRYPVETLTDDPPTVALLWPRQAELEVEPTSRLQLEVRAQDDVGIASVRAHIRLANRSRAARVVEVYSDSAANAAARNEEARPPARLIEVPHQLDLAAQELEPGDIVVLDLQIEDLLGQTATVSACRLLVSLAGSAPEGDDWLASLRDLELSLRDTVSEWTRLPELGLASRVGAQSTDVTAEVLGRLISRVDDIAARCMRSGAQLEDLARSIPVATPSRRFLALLSDSLMHRVRPLTRSLGARLAALQQQTNVRTDASAGAVAIPASVMEQYRAVGVAIEQDWADVTALQLAEEIEDAMERSRRLHQFYRDHVAKLEADRQGRPRGAHHASATTTARLQHMAEEVARWGEGLERLSAVGGTLAGSTGALFRRVRDIVLPDAAPASGEPETDADTANVSHLRQIEGAVGWALDDLSKLEVRARARVADVHDRRESEDWVRRRLDALVASLSRGGSAETAGSPGETSGGVTAAAIASALVEVQAEIELRQDLRRGDVETVAELTAIAEILAQLQQESHRHAAETNRVAERASTLLKAYVDTAPSRQLGLIIGLLDEIVADEERLAVRLGETSLWKEHELRLQARTQNELRRALAAAERLLAKGVIASLDDEVAVTARQQSQDALDVARTSMDEATEAAAALSSQHRDESEKRRTVAAASRAASAMDRAAARLSHLRRHGLADALRAREWLLSQRMSAASRLRRLAARETKHAEEIEVHARAAAPGGGETASRLFYEHELIRADVGAVARRIHGESEIGSPSTVAGTTKRRLLARASAQLERLRHSELLTASRRLEVAIAAASASVPDLYAQAAAFARQASQRMDAIAATLSVADVAAANAEASGERHDAAAAEWPLEEIVSAAKRLAERLSSAIPELRARSVQRTFLAAVVESLEAAKGHFLHAVAAGEAGDRQAAVGAFEAGRRQLDAALASLGEASSPAGEGQDDSALPDGDEDAADQDTVDERDKLAEELAARIARLQEIQELERRISDLLADLEAQGDASAESLDALRKQQEEILERLESQMPSLEELSELVVRLTEIQSDVAELRGAQTGLHRELASHDWGAEKLSATALSELRRGAELQRLLKSQGDEIALRLTRHGFRLAAALPQVAAPYLQAHGATRRLRKTQVDAESTLHTAAASSGRLAVDELDEQFQAVDTALEALMKTLEAIESGALAALSRAEEGGRPGNGRQALEESRAAMAAAARSLQSGRTSEARAAQERAVRSLAEAAQAVRAQAQVQLFDPTTFDAAVDDRLWAAQTRGEASDQTVRFRARGVYADLAYPTRFRELVRAYLEAVAKLRP